MIKCPQNLEISYADTLKADIVSALSGADSLTIDLTQTQRASLSCIQVLVATHVEAAKANIPLTITASEPMTTILQQLGLDITHTQKEDL